VFYNIQNGQVGEAVGGNNGNYLEAKMIMHCKYVSSVISLVTNELS